MDYDAGFSASQIGIRVKMTSPIINLAKQYIDQVKNQGIQVDEAYLYGSYAKGQARDYSDIDICVVSPRYGKDLINEMVELGMIAHKVDDRIEPYPMHPEDFAEKYNLLAHEIRTHGIRIS